MIPARVALTCAFRQYVHDRNNLSPRCSPVQRLCRLELLERQESSRIAALGIALARLLCV
jgi:hypothetical protein